MSKKEGPKVVLRPQVRKRILKRKAISIAEDSPKTVNGLLESSSKLYKNKYDEESDCKFYVTQNC